MFGEKDCYHCYALEGDKCKLGYRIEPLYFSICYIKEEGYRPLGDCPKPETEEAYLQCLRQQKK